PRGRACATNLARLARLSDRYILWARLPGVTSGPTTAHRNDHRSTSGRYTAELRRGWRDVTGSLPPVTHQRASTSCTRIQPLSPQSRRDEGPTPPESWADHWVTVSGRSPGPVH